MRAMNHSVACVGPEVRCAGFMLLMKSLRCLVMGTSSRLGCVELAKKTTDEK